MIRSNSLSFIQEQMKLALETYLNEHVLKEPVSVADVVYNPDTYTFDVVMEAVKKE